MKKGFHKKNLFGPNLSGIIYVFTNIASWRYKLFDSSWTFTQAHSCLNSLFYTKDGDSQKHSKP